MLMSVVACKDDNISPIEFPRIITPIAEWKSELSLEFGYIDINMVFRNSDD